MMIRIAGTLVMSCLLLSGCDKPAAEVENPEEKSDEEALDEQIAILTAEGTIEDQLEAIAAIASRKEAARRAIPALKQAEQPRRRHSPIQPAASAALCFVDPDGYADHLTAIPAVPSSGGAAYYAMSSVRELVRAAARRGLESKSPREFEHALKLIGLCGFDNDDELYGLVAKMARDPKNPATAAARKVFENPQVVWHRFWLEEWKSTDDLAHRRKASEFLRRAFPKDFVAAGREVLKDPDAEVRLNAALGLVGGGDYEIALPVMLAHSWKPGLIGGQSHHFPLPFEQIVIPRMKEHIERVVAIVRTALKMGNVTTRKNAIVLCFKLDVVDFDLYEPYLKDADSELRWSALQGAMKSVENPARQPLLLAAIDEQMKPGKSVISVRYFALQLMSTYRKLTVPDRKSCDVLARWYKTGDPQLQDAVVLCMPSRGPFVADTIAILRLELQEELRKLKAPRYRTSDRVRKALVRIEFLGPAAAPLLPDLLALLVDDATDIRNRHDALYALVAKTLATIGPAAKSGVDLLRGHFDSSRDWYPDGKMPNATPPAARAEVSDFAGVPCPAPQGPCKEFYAYVLGEIGPDAKAALQEMKHYLEFHPKNKFVSDAVLKIEGTKH